MISPPELISGIFITVIFLEGTVFVENHIHILYNKKACEA